MKSFKNILILGFVILALIGGHVAVQLYDPEAGSPIGTPAPTVFMYQAEMDDVVRLTVAKGDAVYSLSRHQGPWVLNEDPAIEISQDKVNTLLYLCANVSAVEPLENPESYPAYGLDVPMGSVTLSKKDGTEDRILVGNTAPDGLNCYAVVDGENQVYLKNGASCSNMLCPVTDLFDLNLYTVASEDITGITISRKGARTIDLSKNPADQVDGETSYEWEMLAPVVKTANEFAIAEKLLKTVNSITASAVVLTQAGDYGFSEPEASFTVKTETKAYTVTVEKTEGDMSYVKLAGRNLIYRLPKSKLSFLSSGYLEYVEKNICVEQLNDVSSVTLFGGGKDYTLSTKDYAVNGKKISESAFKNIYQALAGLVMDDFTDKNGGETLYTLSYHKKDGSKTEVKFLGYDDRNYQVKVDGTGNLLIRKKQIENVLALIESSISE
ncbi:MAG: DUF4340 domain-containing protein [Clostridia bacterium]|nr:DUF4340 domain-containing protein [Clostridia bacterium]